MNRNQIIEAIKKKIIENKNDIISQWNTKHADFDTRYFILDDLLPAQFIKEYVNHLPSKEELLLKESIRERKRVGVDVHKYNPIVGDVLLAFQDKEIIDEITEITNIEGMEPDPTFYASGISIMENNDFLNPHLDNSHDGDQERYRVINLLYYVTPDWNIENGGNLELWDINVSKPTEIHSKFNRLVVMETTNYSYHSVNKVKTNGRRVCVSNYYFSRSSSNSENYKHITTFTGRPEEPLKKLALGLTDGFLLKYAAKFFPTLVKNNKHRIKSSNVKKQ
ncbi:MAG: 2OG-Fe(II) oxygenase [Cytophagales bacterium]|nr:2OG-Fe(II) oxygenase [Cytophagales bacterium]